MSHEPIPNRKPVYITADLEVRNHGLNISRNVMDGTTDAEKNGFASKYDLYKYFSVIRFIHIYYILYL